MPVGSAIESQPLDLPLAKLEQSISTEKRGMRPDKGALCQLYIQAISRCVAIQHLDKLENYSKDAILLFKELSASPNSPIKWESWQSTSLLVADRFAANSKPLLAAQWYHVQVQCVEHSGAKNAASYAIRAGESLLKIPRGAQIAPEFFQLARRLLLKGDSADRSRFALSLYDRLILKCESPRDTSILGTECVSMLEGVDKQNSGSFCIRVGNRLLVCGDSSGAIPWYERSLKYRGTTLTEHRIALMQLGVAYSNLNNVRMSEARLRQCLAVTVERPDYVTAECYLHLSANKDSFKNNAEWKALIEKARAIYLQIGERYKAVRCQFTMAAGPAAEISRVILEYKNLAKSVTSSA